MVSLKSEYNAGYKSATETVRSHGLSWTQRYYKEKMEHAKKCPCSFTNIPGTNMIKSYWEGYADALQNLQDQL